MPPYSLFCLYFSLFPKLRNPGKCIFLGKLVNQEDVMKKECTNKIISGKIEKL